MATLTLRQRVNRAHGRGLAMEMGHLAEDIDAAAGRRVRKLLKGRELFLFPTATSEAIMIRILGYDRYRINVYCSRDFAIAGREDVIRAVCNALGA